MSTAIWPPISASVLQREQEEGLARELTWLLGTLQETLGSLKAGLKEVADLLAPSESSSTLVLSSHRSESVKGFVTRDGIRIIKGDIKVQLNGLTPPRGQSSFPIRIASEHEGAPSLLLHQLVSARGLMDACLDVVDASTWAGDPNDASFIAGQLRLLDVNLQEAKAALKGDNELQVPWYKNTMSPNTFNPPLPDTLSFHLYVQDAAVVLELRTLDLQPAGQATDFAPTYSLRDRLGFTLGTAVRPTHDEVDEIFTWRNQDARVREKIRIESSDPSLMAALAKLTALERTIGLARKNLGTLMGKED